MINFIFSTNVIVGFIWIFGSALIQFVVSSEPRIADNKDGIIIGGLFLSGFILIIHGWRLDPILMFVQELFTVIIALSLYEMLRTRYYNIILTEKIKKESLYLLKSKKKNDYRKK